MIKADLIAKLREQDLLKLSMGELASCLQQLGKSGRGTREELVERLSRAVFPEMH